LESADQIVRPVPVGIDGRLVSVGDLVAERNQQALGRLARHKHGVDQD
jgi:hypothetical protein